MTSSGFDAITKSKRFNDFLKEQILHDEYKPNDKLPSERVLAEQYKIGKMTVHKVLSNLVTEGLLYREQGRGTFVSDRTRQPQAKQSKSLGLIVPDIRGPFHSQIARGIQDIADKHGWQVTFCNSDNDAGKEGEYILKLREQGVAGMLIVTGRNSPQNKYFGSLKENGLPFVTIDREIDGLNADYVGMDDKNGTYAAIKYLIEQGHRRIGCLVESKVNQRNRITGYENALLEAKIKMDSLLIGETGYDGANSHKESQRLLAMKGHVPTAIFIGNTGIISGVFNAVRDAGLRVPDDVSLVSLFVEGFPHLFFGVSLTVVLQPAYRMGEEAARILISKINGEEDMNNVKRILLPTQLVSGESVRPIHGNS